MAQPCAEAVQERKPSTFEARPPADARAAQPFAKAAQPCAKAAWQRPAACGLWRLTADPQPSSQPAAPPPRESPPRQPQPQPAGAAVQRPHHRRSAPCVQQAAEAAQPGGEAAQLQPAPATAAAADACKQRVTQQTQPPCP